MDSFGNYFSKFDLGDNIEFINSSKILGQNIWSIFYYGNIKKIFVNDIISPSLFLGNLLNDEDKVALEMVAKEEEKMKEIEDNEIDKIEKEAEKVAIDDFDALTALTGIYFEAQEPDEQFYDISSLVSDPRLTSFIDEKNPFDSIDNKTKYMMIATGKNLIADLDDTLPPKLQKDVKKALSDIYKSYKTFEKVSTAEDKMEEAMIEQQIDALNKAKEKGDFEPITEGETATVELQSKLGIPTYKTNEMEQEKADIIIFLREQGVTDDFIKGRRMLQKYKNKTEIPITDVNRLVSDTQSRWGPKGEFYLEYATGAKVKNPFSKKGRQKALDKNKTKKKVRKEIEKKRKAKDEEEKKLRNEKKIKNKE